MSNSTGLLHELMVKMIEFDRGDARRIQHFIKVHSLAHTIGLAEGLDAPTQLVLEAAAIVHDIGIHPAEQKYGFQNGKLQEQEGPVPARSLLTRVGFTPEVCDRVAWLVGHHHTYANIEGADYQILVEADFLVNLYEDDASARSIQAAADKIFCTRTGTHLLRTMYGIADPNPKEPICTD